MADMIIASANVALQSQHTYSVRRQTQESLRTWVGNPPTAAAPATNAASSSAVQSAPADDAGGDPRLRLLMLIIEMLTGKRVKVFDASQLESVPASQSPDAPGANPSPPPRAGYGVQYDFHASGQESEQTNFAAQGTVRTADGKEISFQLNLTMSREHTEQVDLSFRAGTPQPEYPVVRQRKDPLVINFGGTAAQLLDTRFRFDLNADGKPVEVPLMAGGSAYLALDLNGNGKIDSGNELFGPASGSGFKELAGYDKDGNGWIDQNDPVLSQLKAWTPDQKGGGSLTGLQGLGVGALYLGYVNTPFELRGQDNGDLGAVRASGLYLTEAGQTGSLQEVDLTV